MLSVGMLVKKAMKGHIDFMGPAQAVGEELTGIPSFDVPDFSETLSEELDMIKKLKKVFLMVSGAAAKKYGADLEEHQQLLLASADILIEVYMSESVILRAKKNLDIKGEEAQKEQIAMARLRLYNAVDKINNKAKEAIISFAEGDEQKMMLMGLKRFTKYHNYPNVVELRNTIADKVIAENTYCF
jgi:hypothetical protein